MKMVRDLKANQNVDEIELTVVAKEPPRFLKTDNFHGLRSVAVGRDRTGEIKLTLWESEASEVELGDRIKITNGYCNEFSGDRALSSGKFGRISIVQAEA